MDKKSYSRRIRTYGRSLMFHRAGDTSEKEYQARLNMPKTAMRFGVDFLDDALRGILPDDLILLGAPSGAGKTQLCCNIAYANLFEGKRVHYIALEASIYEIERRLKFPLVLERYYADPQRPRLENKLSFADWISGAHIEALKPYEKSASVFFEKAF